MRSTVVLSVFALACGAQEAVPVLEVPRCDKGKAEIKQYYVSTALGMVVPKQQTRSLLCWDAEGWLVEEHAEDKHVFSPYKECNSNVWESSDVMEAFFSPVLHETDNPEYYYEMDATPTGAFFVAVINNTKGNASYCPLETCSAGPLPCSGRATFPSGQSANATSTGTSWTVTLRVPWTVFLPKYQPASSVPWPTWRANLYRYDYPEGPNSNYTNFELSAWSPTHDPSFHVPARFGVLKPIM
eukprot:TRINITY_DN32172_c0_g1_i1.p1 TRINITY_DN32172_c0_g1~~TRINITY_DN32172_c0_g1_i1.p1  ORF type:complete len:252 (+),score=56.35 TRINITY_DN32172_c0_g1_i1:32-757(+)